MKEPDSQASSREGTRTSAPAFDVASLSARAFPQATALLANAFHDNPAHVYILPDESKRRPALRWLLERNLRVQAAFGRGFSIGGESRELDAMAFWHPPDAPRVGLPTLLRHGFGAAPLRLGFAATRRMLHVVDAIEQARADAQRDTPAWYLNNMGVRASLRGQGVGGAFLGELLRSVVDPTRAAAVLATQRPENVVFYSRLGFETAREHRIGEGALAFTNWIMMREARPGG